MDSFDGINEFVTVAECQSFSTAAKQLGCSTSHISRQISKLESRVGSALLARSTRLVSLTQTGQLYYEQCKELVIGLQQANEQINTQQVQLNGILRVSVAGTFAEKHIAPVLIKFAQQYPNLTIELDFNSRMINFVEDNIDFAIRHGRLSDSGLIARKLLKRPMMAVASSRYLQQYGIPETPQDLKHHSCIISNNNQWYFESENKIASYIKIKGRWKSNNAQTVVNACEQGLGIAYMPKSNFRESLMANKLIPILAPYWCKGANNWIVYQNKKYLPMRARLAIDYLINHFSDWQE